MGRILLSIIYLFSFSIICEAGEEIIKLNAARSSFRAEYNSAQNHKAFAQSRQGAWAWSSGEANERDAIDSAVAKCTKNVNPGESACIVIHVDDEWIPKEELQKAELTAEMGRADRSGILVLTNESLKREIETSKGRLAVHFSSYDRGCGYCDISNIPVERLAADYRDGIRFARIAWQPWRSMNSEIVTNFKMYGLPTLIIFNDGKEEFRFDGWTASSEKAARAKLDACCRR